MTQMFPPVNLVSWIEEHKEYLKPPVCNRLVFPVDGFYIMVVGGPNSRKDYHYNEGAEFFYQLEGDMILKTIQAGKVEDITIKEGEIFLLPEKTPHSPQRFANTVGLVIEKKRLDSEKDGLHWYCDLCANLLYEEYFHLKNIEEDFPPVFDRFFSNQDHRTCQKCNYVMPSS